jgi:hypothetical protein
MGKYPNHRKPSGYRKCDICGKTFKARGFGTHIREAHKMKINTVVKTTVIDYSNNPITPVNDCSKNLLLKTVPNKDLNTQEVSKVTSKEFTECERPDGQHFYTDTDLWILLARISQIVFNTDTSNLVGLWDSERITREMIQDFERRFECKFDDVKRANPNIKPGKTDSENWELVSKYAALNYSR